ncbi:MAG: hypothetical protein FWF52_03030 [Candidatus Azobacteroides sp.]|nr:hypothetical protein [Candidatus Azobacteroides sp.]
MRLAVNSLLTVYYLFVNLLFIYKYGLRQDFIPVAAILAAYVPCVCAVLFFKFNKIKRLKEIYFAFIFLTALLLLFIICRVDKYALIVDRWSAMEAGIRAWINGEYPYTATDHLNGRTSNFPGLLLIGLPFYLLGNVGLLQVFSFVALAFCLYVFLDTDKALKYILLLLFSPAFWWEIVALSDLMSNFMLVLAFIILIEVYLPSNKFKYPIALGVALAVLLLTRGIVFIPIALYFAKDFYRLPWADKTKTVVAFMVVALLLIISVLRNCPDWETMKHYNPFLLQTSQIPSFVYATSLFLPLLLTFRIKTVCFDLFYYTVALVAIPVLYALTSKMIAFGFHETIVDSIMDLSYLSMFFPFLLMPLSGGMECHLANNQKRCIYENSATNTEHHHTTLSAVCADAARHNVFAITRY